MSAASSLCCRSDRDFLIADSAADGLRQDFRLVFAGQLIPGKIETRAEHLLAPLCQGSNESPDVRQGDKLEVAFGRHRKSVRALAQATDRPWRDGILHEGD